MFRHTDIHMLPAYIFIYAQRHTYIHTYIHAYIHTYILTYTQTYTYNLLCIEYAYVKMRYIHLYTHTHIYIYIYTYAQTVRHTHQHICRLDMHLEQVEDRIIM